MKRTLTNLFYFATVSLFSIGCQTAAPDLPTIKPTPASPFPAWTKQAAEKPKSVNQVLITTKIVEITRPVDSPDIPAKRYEKKLTDPQFQVIIREFNQKKGADLMSAPSVITRDGQQARVEIIREHVYPVGPETSAKKKTENVGVTALFQPRYTGKAKIHLKTFIRVCELDSFSDVTPDFNLPVFKRRDVETSTDLKDGETIMIGGIVDEMTQDIEDSGPLGIVKKHSTAKFSRELIVFVSAQLIDPAGKRIGE